MRLFIAEKPELARAIAEGLGGGTPRKGFIECGADRVTWCIGHMLELLEPHEYDPRLAKWSLADLPFSFVPWRKRPIAKTEAQLDIILSLLPRASSVVHAGDPDAEGQLLVDEVLQHAGYRGPVSRLLINDNTPAVVRRALASMRDNKEFAGLSAAAEARGVGDQLYGFNMTRAYTLAAQAAGYSGVLSVGRVQTAILGLVVRRDRAHASHSKAYYHTVTAAFDIEGVTFDARFQIPDGAPVDDKGRLIDKAYADGIASQVMGQPASVQSAATVAKTASPPLPYNLLKLQTDASRKWGYKPDLVKDVTQALREKHRLITYNRSDCEYLSDEQHPDAPAVLAAIRATAPVLAPACGRADPAIKSRAFNSGKVSAHHAIIPTVTTADLAALSEPERNLYLLIARAYVAQFWPLHHFDQTTLTVTVAGHAFSCRAKVATQAGWKSLYRNDADNEDFAGDEDDLSADLRALRAGQQGCCTSSAATQQETKPPPLYTMATLLSDLTRVARYVRDPQLRALLVEKDQGKEGEHGGIGTPATRDTMIATLLQRQLLAEQGKAVVSTAAARDLYDALPDEARFPDMTALWHNQQKEIESGKRTIESFVAELSEYIAREVGRVKSAGLAMNVKTYDCPSCKRPMRKRASEKGAFWGCTGYPECKTTYPDKDGKPFITQTFTMFKCPSCQSGLSRNAISGKKAGYIWKCTAYNTCGASYADRNGKPVLVTRPRKKG